MVDVEIYTRDWCGYCARAKDLLDRKGVNYREYNASQQPELRAEMIERAGRATFPQIFIGDVHVGGCDDLFVLHDSGRLDPLLATGILEKVRR